MRTLRFLIPLLVLSAALLVALVRPLPSRAGDGTQATGDQTAKPAPRKMRRTAHRHHRQHLHPFGQRVVGYARKWLGVPYRYGGDTPRSGFDCSGFVRFVYSHFGVSLPHSSFADIVRGRRVARRWLKPGDLVFFDDDGHVGIYVGGHRFIHAPHTGTVVQISTMSGWYGATYDGARRVHAYR